MVKRESTQVAHYQLVARAIDYLQQHFKSQPSLQEVARAVGMSSSHLQRVFDEWAGVSPKKFLQYVSVEHAKRLLRVDDRNVMEASHRTGLSGMGRLHDLFVTIEAMTPGEFRRGGEGLMVNYSMADTPFGQVVVASTDRGVCHMSFLEEDENPLDRLKSYLPKATFVEDSDDHQLNALKIYSSDWTDIEQIKLHLKGTDFQLKVWQSLLQIPWGDFSTYGKIAHQIHTPNASRAVGTAISNNPVAFLIPCHRVLTSNGTIGGYRWGTTRKRAMLGWENVREV